MKKILIVEDEKSMAKVLSLKLTNMGFECSIASNGEEAIQIMQQQKFDLIVLDLMMPQKDGFTFLNEIRNSGNHTPIMIASNLSQPEDIERAKKFDIVSYFSKADTPISTVVNYIGKIMNENCVQSQPQQVQEQVSTNKQAQTNQQVQSAQSSDQIQHLCF